MKTLQFLRAEARMMAALFYLRKNKKLLSRRSVFARLKALKYNSAIELIKKTPQLSADLDIQIDFYKGE